jgi:hypothetical protein
MEKEFTTGYAIITLSIRHRPGDDPCDNYVDMKIKDINSPLYTRLCLDIVHAHTIAEDIKFIRTLDYASIVSYTIHDSDVMNLYDDKSSIKPYELFYQHQVVEEAGEEIPYVNIKITDKESKVIIFEFGIEDEYVDAICDTIIEMEGKIYEFDEWPDSVREADCNLLNRILL